MNIGKRVKVCYYCKKSRHVIVDCRKKAVKVNKMSEEKKKIRCYHCDQIRHMTKDCKVKIRIVNNLEEVEEVNKASSQYFSPKRVKRGEVVSCWDCVKKRLSRDCGKNIIDPQHVIHQSMAGYDSTLRKHTLQTYQDESDLNVHLV
jgi:hypothetical protein